MIGVLGAVLGLLPWLATGAQLPLQNLWATEILPADMPLSLLPLSQYKLVTLVALLTTGGAAAGMAVRYWSGRKDPARRRQLAWCAAAGVLLVQAVATVQSFAVLREGLAPAGRPLEGQGSIYFSGLLGGVIAAILAGAVVLLLISARPQGVAALGIGLAAVPFASWATAWHDVFSGPGGGPSELLALARWLPAVVVGAALAWCGFRPVRNVAVWVVNLALLWVVPALFISVQYVFGTRVALGDFQEMALMGRQILAATLGPAGGAGPSVLLALAIGLLGTGVMELLRRRRQTTAAAPGGTLQSGSRPGL
ncbi:hypothetical protein BIU82_08365 [Arthrobacter sp. SW1]|nr:hypothetical protein BIU82_08365 [Arthrobacter sp. SW1]